MIDYEELFRKYGPVYLSVGWCSEQSQQTKYRKIYEYMPNITEKTRIVDVGCGYGGFLDFLHVLPHNPFYVGIDKNSIALQRINATKCRSVEMDITDFSAMDYFLKNQEEIDYIICCGVFQHLSRNNGASLIKAFTTYANRTIISVRSARSDRDKDLYTEWSISDIDIATTDITSRLVIDHSYAKHDMVVVLDREL